MTDTHICPAEHFANACAALEGALELAYEGQRPDLPPGRHANLHNRVRHHVFRALIWLNTRPTQSEAKARPSAGSNTSVDCTPTDLCEPAILNLLAWSPEDARLALQDLLADDYRIVSGTGPGLAQYFRILRTFPD